MGRLEFTQAELDGLLERAVSAREDKEFHDKVQKADGALDDAVGLFVLEGETARGAIDCSDLCKTPVHWPNWFPRIQPGWVIEVHPGDPKRSRPPFRRLHGAEAEKAVSLQIGLRVFNERLAIKAAQNSEAEVLRREVETRQRIKELEHSLVEIANEKAAAREKIAEAKGPLDSLFSSRSAAYRRAAIDLSQSLNATRGADAPYSMTKPLALGDYSFEPAAAEDEGRE